MKIAIFDIDGTLTDSRVWGGIMDYFWKNKINLVVFFRFAIVHIPRLIFSHLNLLSQNSFRRKWAKDLALYFKGISREEGDYIWKWIFIHRIEKIIRKDILDIVKSHINNEVKIVLLSGGPQQLVQYIVNHIGGDFGIGTEFEFIDGIYSGKIVSEPCVGLNKAVYLNKFIQKNNFNIVWEDSFAYGDSISDVQYMSLTANPVAVYPDVKLRDYAQENGWHIIE